MHYLIRSRPTNHKLMQLSQQKETGGGGATPIEFDFRKDNATRPKGWGRLNGIKFHLIECKDCSWLLLFRKDKDIMLRAYFGHQFEFQFPNSASRSTELLTHN